MWHSMHIGEQWKLRDSLFLYVDSWEIKKYHYICIIAAPCGDMILVLWAKWKLKEGYTVQAILALTLVYLRWEGLYYYIIYSSLHLANIIRNLSIPCGQCVEVICCWQLHVTQFDVLTISAWTFTLGLRSGKWSFIHN